MPLSQPYQQATAVQATTAAPSTTTNMICLKQSIPEPDGGSKPASEMINIKVGQGGPIDNPQQVQSNMTNDVNNQGKNAE